MSDVACPQNTGGQRAKDSALHYELHGALHSFIGENLKDDLVWTDIGLINLLGTFDWHAMINMACKDRAESAKGPSCEGVPYCFTGLHGLPASCLGSALIQLELESNRDGVISLANIAKQTEVVNGDTVYLSHDYIPNYPWIREKFEFTGGNPSSGCDNTVVRNPCIPGGFTAVSIPLVLNRNGERGLAGCIIICGRIDSLLWLLLPRMKATALSLLEPKRDKIILLQNQNLLLGYLRSYPPGNGLFRTGAGHEQAISAQLAMAPDLLGQLYKVHQNTTAKWFFKALLCWRGNIPKEVRKAMDPNQIQVGQGEIKGVLNSTKRFETRIMVKLLDEILGIKIKSSGFHTSLPTTCGAIALIALIDLWQEIHSGQDQKEMQDSLEIISKNGTVRWVFTLGKDYGNLLKNLMEGQQGNTLTALSNAVLGLIKEDYLSATNGTPAELRAIFQRTNITPVMYPQFIPGELTTIKKPQLHLVWPLSQKDEKDN